MYKLIRPILFQLDAEQAHKTTFRLLLFFKNLPGGLSLMKLLFAKGGRNMPKEIMGIKVANPIGLAAGFDKDAKLISAWDALGFGFVEIGTLTPKPQPGNDRPRLFRLKNDQALINRMGFNNEGVSSAVKRLKKRNPLIVVGGNIGKNKITPNAEAILDYEITFKSLHPYVDYFVVNVSSPNTPGLRELQEKGPLLAILNRLMELNSNYSKTKPILLKIAPDLNNNQLNDIIEIVKSSKVAGVIATNTTISREDLSYSKEYLDEIGNGGLSGKPLRNRATEVIKVLRAGLGKDFTIIGVGGIMTAEHAVEKMEAGADLIQLYTGFVYEGPSLIKRILKRLKEKNLH